MYTVCAFYTSKTSYEDIIKNLEDSCNDLNLTFYKKAYLSLGSWALNISYKPSFILDCLLKLETDILYVDADAVIRKDPNIGTDFDLAVHYLNGELLSGTIYAPFKPRTIQLVQQWCEVMEKERGKWDQVVLQKMLKKSPYNIFKLPAEYTKIFDNRSQKVEPVIEHFQASRKARRDLQWLQ
jgi:hypothetical protein